MQLTYQVKDALTELKFDFISLLQDGKEKDEILSIIDALRSEDVKKQDEAIATLKKLSADNKNANFANFNVVLGFCYELGIILEKNEKSAFEHFEIANKAGNLLGLTNVARYYLDGNGVNQDVALAMRMLQIASNQGYAEAKFILASYYEDCNRHRDVVQLMQEAAERKYPRAIYTLARMYIYTYSNPKESEESKPDSKLLVQQDIPKGLKLMEIAAEYFIAVQSELGKMYLGLVYETNSYRDPAKAFFYLSKATENSHPEAGINLFRCYLWGRGMQSNKTKAFELLENLAKKGQAIAIGTLGEHIDILTEDHFQNLPQHCCSKPNATQAQTAATASQPGNATTATQTIQPSKTTATIATATTSMPSIATTATIIAAAAKPAKAESSIQEGFKILKRAAELGAHSRQLAECYEKGIGTEKDLKKAAECYENIIAMDNPSIRQLLEASYAVVSNRFGQWKNHHIKPASEKDSNDITEKQDDYRAFRRLEKLAEMINDNDLNIRWNPITLYAQNLYAILRLVGHPRLENPNAEELRLMGCTWIEKSKDIRGIIKGHWLPVLKRGILNLGQDILSRSHSEEQAKKSIELWNIFAPFALQLIPQKGMDSLLTGQGGLSTANFPYSIAYHLCWIAQKRLAAILPATSSETTEKEKEEAAERPVAQTDAPNKPTFYFRMMEAISSLEQTLCPHYKGDAQYYLAQCHEKGYGTPMNLPKAISFYQDAIRIKTAHTLILDAPVTEVNLEDVLKREAEVRQAFMPRREMLLFTFQQLHLNEITALPLADTIMEYAIELPEDSATPYEYMPEFQTPLNISNSSSTSSAATQVNTAASATTQTAITVSTFNTASL